MTLLGNVFPSVPLWNLYVTPYLLASNIHVPINSTSALFTALFFAS